MIPTIVQTDKRTSLLKVVQPQARVTALGMAVAFFMTDPVFARLPFGHWSRVLVGQIKRKHFVFVLSDETVVGFAGWALASRENAEDWLMGRKDLSFDQSQDGEIIVVNAWKATTTEANRALLDLGRRMVQTKAAIYYKRYYANGRMRPVRLNVPRQDPGGGDCLSPPGGAHTGCARLEE